MYLGLDFVEPVRSLVNSSQHSIRLLVENRRRCLCRETAVGANLHTLAGSIAIEEALKCINDAFDGCQDAFFLEGVVEDIGRDLRSYDVRADGV